MPITVASWNILNDYWAKHGIGYPIQQKRLDQIVSDIKIITKKNESFVLFLCELEIDNLEFIAKQTGLAVVGLPYEYKRLATIVPKRVSGQYVAFLADKKTAKDAKLTRARTKTNNRDAILCLEHKGYKIFGTHVPQRPVVDFFTRREHIKTLLGHRPNIVMGDFNATPIFPSRWRLLRRGYIEVHRKNRPRFPHPYYRSRNIHRWWPTMNIDVMFSQGLDIRQPNYSLTTASDHPLIWAEFEVKA